ncbi:MAG TPA: methyltransferase domain-containing protein [Vicinamibacterales bacterium]|nr:methyltransferase domain-containing protein [Vicinamibacterales bacterium]HOQ59745.1 methyltransferase domain-containing protein [Vicinamibacterales bacterium]HPK72928.1 methyltransferase domain-containing protein [Vicinamibacterales bacterium]
MPMAEARRTGASASAGRAQRDYWNEIGRAWARGQRDASWRGCSDAIHERWLGRVAADLQGGRVLKTDLFNEAIGDGFAGWFERRGCRMLACDVAWPTAARAAARHPSIAVVAADVRTLPLAPGAIDAVLSDSTLDHFACEAEIAASLRELRRTLRRGGTLLLTMDNPRNPLIRLRNLCPGFWHRLGIVPYMVGVTCTRRRLEQMLDAAGFEVEASATIMHAPRVAAVWLCRWWARATRRNRPAPWLVASLLAAEHLDRLPTRELTGHFVAIRARAR